MRSGSPLSSQCPSRTLTGRVGRTRSVPNLVTHAALHVRRQLNELLAAQRCALLNSAEVLVERCELDSPAFCLYFNLLETRTADQ
jgi:hypothetical protein